MHYIYILKFNKDKNLYTGYTKNLKLRLQEHRDKKVGSTKNRGSFELIYYEASINQQDATHREKYLKTYLGKMFLRNRLKSYLTG